MAKYQAYAEYKDSGVEWLGEIPSHWDYFDGKRIFSSVRKQALSSDEQLAASQKYGVIPQNLMMQLNDSKVMLALKGTESFRHVEKNNFVISLRSFEGGIEHSNYEGCVSPAYTVLSSKKNIDYRYFKYLFKSAPFIAALQSTTDSLRDGKSISYEQFGNITLPLFSKVEQNTIANFLDHETTKINHLIEKQQKLIELLKEKRQAVISYLVNVKEGEASIKLKYAVEILAGYSFSSTGFKTDSNDGVALLRGINVGVGNIKWDECVWWSKSDTEGLERYILKKGDLVFGMDRPWISTGARVAEIQEYDLPSYLVQRVARVRALRGFYQPYIKLILGSKEFKSFIESDLTGVSVPHISTDQIISFPIRKLYFEQQVKQTDQAIESINKIDFLIVKAESAIQLMQERRTALISAVVTGKIDVRNWQAPTIAEAQTEFSA
ncbi:MAG: restriction endonuclease subunit S [Acinetobacter sp.]|uniref:restriction endonuclease subunit S n=1 Tax=Acinetobacter sp. TaxID=472 RepID=UPI003D031A12